MKVSCEGAVEACDTRGLSLWCCCRDDRVRCSFPMVRGMDVEADLRMSAAIRTGGAIRFSAGAKAPGSPGKNEVLVSVRASGINPFDYKLLKLLGGPIAGLDLDGVAVAVGHGVKG